MYPQHYRLYGFFVASLVSILLTCDALAFKVVTIDGYSFAASGLIFAISFPLASIATEVYGYKLAGRIIWYQLIAQLFFVLTVTLMVRVNPTEDPYAVHYLFLYKNLWRIILSTIALASAYFINDLIISVLKKYYGSFLLYRLIISNAAGDFLLVAITYPVTFHHQYSISFIIKMIINTWFYKVIIAVVLLPVSLVFIKKVKSIENVDTYDYGTSYNPIRVFENTETEENLYEKYFIQSHSAH